MKYTIAILILALTSPLDLTAGDSYWLVIWSDTAGARVQADPVGTAYFGIYSYLDLAGQWPDPISLTGGQTHDIPQAEALAAFTGSRCF